MNFHDKYEPITETGCWIWTGTTTTYKGDERGRFSIKGKAFAAHRFSYLLFKGEIPAGKQVNHHCDTSICVNPDHLYIGTQLDNMRDRTRRGRAVYVRGEEHTPAKLTESNVREILSSSEPQRVLALRYGVNQSCISLIKRRKTWAHIECASIVNVPRGRPAWRRTEM